MDKGDIGDIGGVPLDSHDGVWDSPGHVPPPGIWAEKKRLMKTIGFP